MASAAQADTSADTKSGMSEENGEIENKRPMFGNRLLVDPNQVFSHNAWDNIAWSDEQIERAQAKVMEISSEVLDSDSQRCYEDEADKFWDKFYGVHQNRFFKDRNWLFTEFPELEVHSALVGQQELMESSYEGCVSRRQILEVGCGVGNTVFPLLSTLPDDDLFVYCCDFSPVAVNLVKENPAYDTKRCHAFVCDVSDPDAEVPFPEGSIDIITLVFTMSAIHPDNNYVFRSFKELRNHVRKEHELFYCDLCVDNVKNGAEWHLLEPKGEAGSAQKQSGEHRLPSVGFEPGPPACSRRPAVALRIFTFERKGYSRSDLARHRRTGDPDDKSHKGHPLCEFCDVRFMDNDDLYRHLRKDHYFCHFCDADGVHNIFYSDYEQLRKHFRSDHFLCEEGTCYQEKFTCAFRSEIDLKAHKAQRHIQSLGKAEARQARTLELEFSIGSRGRGRPRPGQSPSSATPSTVPPFSSMSNVTVTSSTIMSPAKGPQPLFSLEQPIINTQSSEEFPSLGPSGKSVSSADGSADIPPSMDTLAQRLAKQNRFTTRSTYSKPTHNIMEDEEEFPSLGATLREPGNQTNIVVTSGSDTGLTGDWNTVRVRINSQDSLHPTTCKSQGRTNNISFELNRRWPSPSESVQGSVGGGAIPKKRPQARITCISSSENITVHPPKDNPPVIKTDPVSLSSISSSLLSCPKQDSALVTSKDEFPSLTQVVKPEKLLPSHRRPQKNGLHGQSVQRSEEAELEWESSRSLKGGGKNKKGKNKDEAKQNGLEFNLKSLNVEPVEEKKGTRAPPGFSGVPERRSPPPGFTVPLNLANSIRNPFGDIPSPTEMTFTNSSGESYSLAKYVPPKDFGIRNQELLTKILVILGGDLEKLDLFKKMSSDFRTGCLDALEYHTQCSNLFGDSFQESVFPELVCLLPDTGKQQELVQIACLLSSAKDLKVWLKDKGLVMCDQDTCKQVVQWHELGDHVSSHVFIAGFPALPKPGSWCSEIL
ncbi:unnamed protein product [Darwinula stevensoni]|uniref:C2H2-type domain-containing protein n=1 Tax=Darwinula stevensoni TaxID=69355 RepID=A0A7R8XIH3_9CRUS|nr:unnamed protein product [Darwinula stevensoni]CAG0891298.1 unnamed protein product [Darwinula stevensoni]